MIDVSQLQNSTLDKMIALLKEIFQYDKADLDFGMYRIINLRKQEIQQFIETKLTESIKKYTIALENVKESDTMQKNIDFLCNHIINFFQRYYDAGDFISKRRYSKTGVYSIPYNGEELYFYWANHDQYYIKTSEDLRMYSFAYRNYKINFEIHENEVEIEKSNNKIMEKKYYLFKSIEQPNNKEITIKFGFRVLKEEEEKELKTQDKAKTITDKAIFAYNFAKIKESKCFDAIHSIYNTTQQDNLRNDSQSISVLEWHLRKFMTKNLSDYFIHKDLTGFLTQELDNYVKSEMLDINSLDQNGLNNSNGVEINLSQGLIISLEKIRHFRDISGQIIKYLGQIEDFQRSLWEKTKFIISTNYCICLDLVPETYFNEIFSNELQLKEWESYGASIKSLNDTDKRKSGNKNKRFFDFISANPGLMIDTIHFTVDFKYRLLSSIQDLHLKMAGILINSDNFHGLKLLQSMFKGRFKAIYIDPPYNAKSSEILYKNNFKHSSWLCMMQNRINLSKSLLKQSDGMFVCAIDENENESLAMLLDSEFPGDFKRTAVSIIHNPRGIQGKGFSYNHEFAHFIYPNQLILSKRKLDKQKMKPLMKTGSESERTTAKNCFYPIYYHNGEISCGDIPDEDFHPEQSQIIHEDGKIELWPICTAGKERKWRYAKDSFKTIIEDLFIQKTSAGQYVVYLEKDLESYKTVWTDAKYNAAEYGSNLIKNIIPEFAFSFPKSIHTVKDCLQIELNSNLSPSEMSENKKEWILDFFAGSGTTGHAVLKLNEENDSNYRFVLIEMGEYFDTVLKTRIKKVIYANEWKQGKPVAINDKGGKIVKYHILEQFEDSILNIENTEAFNINSFQDYLIRYLYARNDQNGMNYFNIDQMTDPMSYKMKIMTKTGIREEPVDLIETFNYIIGMEPQNIKYIEIESMRYIAVQGNLNEKTCIAIWRSLKDGFNPIKDKDIITEHILKDNKFDRIFVNGNSLIEGAESIELYFKNRM